MNGTRLPQVALCAAQAPDEGAAEPPLPDPLAEPAGVTTKVPDNSDAPGALPDSMPDSMPDSSPEIEKLPPPPDSTTDTASAGADEDLVLSTVESSVLNNFPLIRAAFASRTVAAGAELSALGNYDLNLRAHSEAGPLGFYQTYRNLARVDQQIYSGGKAFAHYRLGRGVFQPWYLERQTNEGGEFLAGFEVPLKQNRTIDKQRQQLWLANLRRAQVEPEIQTDIIEFTRQASYAYWEWVAAGELLQIAESLLEFAEEREDALERLAEEGEGPAIDVVDNNRLITLRQAKVIDAERKLQQSALKLSLYLRYPDGNPRVVPRDALPDGFPLADRDLDQQETPAVELALERRPELATLNIERDKLDVELAQANNLFLPELNAYSYGSQDVGEPTSPKRDKSQFELEVALRLMVPLQRREARGKIESLRGKIAQLNAKQRFTVDKIAVEVRAALTGLKAAARRIDRDQRSLELAEQVLKAERRQFQLGASDLLRINLREVQVANVATELVVSRLDYYLAETDFHAAQGTVLTGLP